MSLSLAGTLKNNLPLTYFTPLFHKRQVRHRVVGDFRFRKSGMGKRSSAWPSAMQRLPTGKRSVLRMNSIQISDPSRTARIGHDVRQPWERARTACGTRPPADAMKSTTGSWSSFFEANEDEGAAVTHAPRVALHDGEVGPPARSRGRPPPPAVQVRAAAEA